MKAKGQSEAFGEIEKSLRKKEKKHRKHSTGIGEAGGGGVPVKEKGQNKQSPGGGQAKGGRRKPDYSLGGKKIKKTRYDSPQQPSY